MKLLIKLFVLQIFVVAGIAGCSKSCSKAEPQRVFFSSPNNGDVVSPSFDVEMGVEGMTVRPAGEDVFDKTSGHHHILIDNDKGYIEEGQVVPADEKNIHFGKGQTQTTLTLPPGQHKLTLQFADGAHISYGKKMSATVTVRVEH